MRPRQSGASLLALMIASGISLVIALMAMHVVALSSTGYLRTEQDALLQDQAAWVLDVFRVAIQQAGYVDASQSMPAQPARPDAGALTGFDDVIVPVSTPGFNGVHRGGIGGSDALAVRFAGDSKGWVRNCAGLPVKSSITAADDRGWSIFHVSTDRQGEPELRCKYRGESGWTSQAIASGIESFQLLYGLDLDDDGLPNDFVSAARLQALDVAADKGADNLWTRVVAVHVALLLRSPQRVRVPLPDAIELFGNDYARLHGNEDPGSTLTVSQLRSDRLYRQSDAVIFLGNSLRPSK